MASPESEHMTHEEYLLYRRFLREEIREAELKEEADAVDAFLEEEGLL